MASLAGMAALATVMVGCIDTSKIASPRITPPEETLVDRPAGSSVEIIDEVNLVYSVKYHRAMYARYLQALIDYYSRCGQREKAEWARIELTGLRRIKAYNYIADTQAPALPPAPATSGTIGEATSEAPLKVTLVADRDKPEPQEVPNPLEYPPGIEIPDIPLDNVGEVDLVENMALHRDAYTRFLTALTKFYSEQGFPEKAACAQTELNGLRQVKTYKYILEAEVPRADLKPLESIAEADRLYEQGLKILRKGGRGFPCFYNQTTMRQALVKFKALIENYPTSDKIDDAAYYIAEIHKEYEKEKDNTLAIEWYKRAIQWDPNTPHPCRFRIATTYDYRLHERENALYWYQRVLDEESKFTARDHIDFAGNTAYARKRIRELTPEEHLYAPGEAPMEGHPEGLGREPAPPPSVPPPPAQRQP